MLNVCSAPWTARCRNLPVIECEQHPQFSLSAQVALITGAGSPAGIGFVTATLLAELGCRVALCATGPRVTERALDLTSKGHAPEATWPT